MAISLIVFAILAGILAREAILDRRAKRRKTELEASFLPHDGWIREENNGTIEYALLDRTKPLWRVNSHLRQPESFEREAHIIEHAPKQIASQSLTMPLQGESTDLFTLIDSYPHVLIYGGTGLGKTSLERMLAHRRKLSGQRVLILDTHEHPAKWQGLDRMDTPQKVNAAITALFALLNKNVEDLRTGQATEDSFEKITIITDEWTEIVSENDTAKQFIATMVRQSRKYGISLVFATQTNLASDLGLDGRYKTINGFLQLRLAKNSSGTYLAFAHTSTEKLGEFIVPSPLPLPQLTASNDYMPTRLDDILVNTEITQLSEQESKVAQMLASGESRSAIARELFGYAGGNQLAQVDKIIAKISS